MRNLKNWEILILIKHIVDEIYENKQVNLNLAFIEERAKELIGYCQEFGKGDD